MRGITIVVLCTVGCVRSGEIQCADGSICVAGTECRVASGVTLCVPSDELHDCDGKVLFEECGDAGHLCFDSTDGLICWPAGCGNHLLDPGEQCDLGDTIIGDGCSADCRSTETCGNGVVDPVHFEQCDDGDLGTHDGCSSTCRLEEPIWADAQPALLDPQEGAGLAYDIRRGRFVVFGGLTGTVIPTVGDATFEWTGSGWISPVPGIAPSPRSDPAMAYDSSTGETVLFGGSGYADTWIWNGTRWRTLEAFKPAGRTRAVMAFDARRKVMIMFGGTTSAGATNETWQFAGGVWTEVVTATQPAVTTLAAMAYDPVRDAIVLVQPGAAWELSNGDWHPLPPPPAFTSQPTVAFDPISGRIVTAGLTSTSTSFKLYAFDGSGWPLVHATSQTIGARGAALVGDPVHRRLLYLATADLGMGAVEQVFYEWDGLAWVSRASAIVRLPGSTGGMSGAAMASDPLHGRVLMFGGRTSANVLHPADTWSFDGATWKIINTFGPNPRFDHAMAYDIARDRLVLFGGTAGGSTTSDTWLFDGASWTIATGLNPPARRQHAMAYDVKRKRVVMFGGNANAGAASDCLNCLSDTWEWDGAAWTKITTATTPTAVAGARLAYDYSIGKLVMFGGTNGNSVNTTWTYDGVDWHLEPIQSSPNPRAYGALVWNGGRGHLMYIGGGTQPALLIGTVRPVDGDWELDMQQYRWQRVAVQDTIEPRFRQAAASSPDGNGVLSVGGSRQDVNGADTNVPVIVNKLVWQGDDREETCASRVDADGDGLVNCADGDCWSVCRPLCPRGDDSCLTSTPHCGDGACSAPLEQKLNCPEDCGVPPVTCGDLVCDPGEMCPGDCP